MHKIIMALMLLAPTAALAHTGHGETSHLMAGLAHPLSGLDHVTVMVAVGLLAALKGGRALWLWPLSFVAAMLVGGALGMAQAPLPLVEPAILASIVVLGLLLALAIDLPVGLGAMLLGAFALFHGHAHGTEAVADGAAGYMAGFAIMTVALHLAGIGIVVALRSVSLKPIVRFAGAACVLIGIALSLQLV